MLIKNYMAFALIMLLILLKMNFSDPKLANDISFRYYKNEKLIFIGTGSSKDQLNDTKCAASDKFAFITHGWRESCQKNWMKMLRKKLAKYRGGCIVCIDYEKLARGRYLCLYAKFDSLVKIMTKKLKDQFDQGVNPSNMYLFGFSYGGQLVLAIGANFQQKKIQAVDACDPAGVGFDLKPWKDHRKAGHNVQCIHTSNIIGTSIYACHQNWRMGRCGVRQPLKCSRRIRSHLLCPLFYISAFENPFYAIKKPRICRSKNVAKNWPQGFKMGYTETRKSQVAGELFAFTRCMFPYNVLRRRRSTSRTRKLMGDFIITLIGFIYNLSVK